VTDAELDERAALNDLLLGFDRPSFEARERFYFENVHIGPLARNHSLIPARLAGRLAAYDRTHANLSAALDRFAVRYVRLPAGTKPTYLSDGWAPVVGGPTWQIWERIISRNPDRPNS
jgi:hypothetical protein